MKARLVEQTTLTLMLELTKEELEALQGIMGMVLGEEQYYDGTQKDVADALLDLVAAAR